MKCPIKKTRISFLPPNQSVTPKMYEELFVRPIIGPNGLLFEIPPKLVRPHSLLRWVAQAWPSSCSPPSSWCTLTPFVWALEKKILAIVWFSYGLWWPKLNPHPPDVTEAREADQFRTDQNLTLICGTSADSLCTQSLEKWISGETFELHKGHLWRSSVKDQGTVWRCGEIKRACTSVAKKLEKLSAVSGSHIDHTPVTSTNIKWKVYVSAL